MIGANIEFDELHKLNRLGESARLSTVKWLGWRIKLSTDPRARAIAGPLRWVQQYWQ